MWPVRICYLAQILHENNAFALARSGQASTPGPPGPSPSSPAPAAERSLPCCDARLACLAPPTDEYLHVHTYLHVYSLNKLFP